MVERWSVDPKVAGSNLVIHHLLCPFLKDLQTLLVQGPKGRSTLAFTPKGNALWFVRTKGSLDTFAQRAKGQSTFYEKNLEFFLEFTCLQVLFLYIYIYRCKVAERPDFCRSIVERQYREHWSDYAHISSQQSVIVNFKNPFGVTP